MQGLLGSFEIKLSRVLTGGFDPHTRSYIDTLAAFTILIVGVLIFRGVHQASRIEDITVNVKLLVILILIVVGVTTIHP